MSPDMPPAVPQDIEATLALLSRARSGDDVARDDLFRRFQPALLRFLHGRLPTSARGVMDTHDVAQEACVRVFRSLDRFDHRGVGSFWGYLRRVAINVVRDLPKTPGKLSLARPLPDESWRQPQAAGHGPAQKALHNEQLEAFERALGTLSEERRQAVLMRVELDLDYRFIATECGMTSPDAARMAITRALQHIAVEMSRDGERRD